MLSLVGTRFRFDTAYLALVATVLLLGWANIGLSRETAAFREQVRALSPGLSGGPAPEIGDILPSLQTVDSSGRPVTLKYDGSRRYLLFLFLPSCEACGRAARESLSIVREAQVRDVQVVYISLASSKATKPFLPNLPSDGAVLILPSRAHQRAYRVTAVPQFMLVSPIGEVEWLYNGVMPSEVGESLRSKLAGVSSATNE